MAIGPFLTPAILAGTNAIRSSYSSNYSYQTLFNKRFLDQRSRISFHYPDNKTIVFLPFYENPTIVETQAATYGTHAVVGRSSPLFSYLGSKAKKIKVSMYFTLPHLAMHEMGVSRFMRVFSNSSKASERELFHKKGTKFNTGSIKEINSLALAVEKEYLQLEKEHNDEYESLLSKADSLQVKEDIENKEPSEMINVVDTLLFFISLLRTSVVNNAEDPLLGPPLLRLSFGTLYQAVPCICKSYNLAWEEEAGYHMETLTPRRLKIDLVLEEVRVGNFQGYIPGKFIHRDNLAGWEATLKHGTTDPLVGAGVNTPGGYF